MPIYEFNCIEHKLFSVFTRMGGSPDESPCPSCGERGTRVFSAPALVNVKRSWDDKASDYQRNPYTQAKAQLTNVAREEAERSGMSPQPVREESIQAAAKSIADKRPRKSAVQRTVDAQRKLTREKRAKDGR